MLCNRIRKYNPLVPHEEAQTHRGISPTPERAERVTLSTLPFKSNPKEGREMLVQTERSNGICVKIRKATKDTTIGLKVHRREAAIISGCSGD